MACQLHVEYSGALDHFTARGNDQQAMVHDETDRTDFLTRLGQEILSQRSRSAKASNDPFSLRLDCRRTTLPLSGRAKRGPSAAAG